MSLPDVVSGLLLRGRPGVRIPFGAPDNNAESLCFQGFSAFLLSSKRKNNQASLGEDFLFYCCKGIMVRVCRLAYIIQLIQWFCTVDVLNRLIYLSCSHPFGIHGDNILINIPLVAIAIIVIVRTLGFLVSKMVIHFSFHHFFDDPASPVIRIKVRYNVPKIMPMIYCA